MTELSLRDMVVEDIDRISEIRFATIPWFVASVECQRSWYVNNPPEAQPMRLVAELDGQIVAFASAMRVLTTSEPDVASMSVTVHPEARGHGVGTALYAPLAEHLSGLDARKVHGYAIDDEATHAWLERRGFTKGAGARFSRVDPRELPPMPEIQPGVELRSFAELGPDAVHKLDNLASVDEPGDVSYDGMPYDMFMNRVWNSPDMNLDVCTVAVVDGVPASAAFLEMNRAAGRAISSGACTLREYRGRGLSKLVKSVTLRKAAELGVTQAVTGNDYENKPMLAVNDWLGYQPFTAEYSFTKQLRD